MRDCLQSPAEGVTYGAHQCHASTSVESDMLGQVEPGTHVLLDGVVWNELDTGMLVVNVNWRSKSYVGTLLDCSRYDWAPPRQCESPLLELTPAKSRNGNAKRRGNWGGNGKTKAALKVRVQLSSLLFER